MRFNPAPGWPAPPPGWMPPPGWAPDPRWPPAPPGWCFWVAETGYAPTHLGAGSGIVPAPAWQQPPVYPYPTVVVVGAEKSVALAAVLGFLFGPVGLLYASVGGAVLLFLINLVVGLLTFGVGLVLTWPLAAVWGAVAASQHNARIRAVTARPW